MLFLIANQWGLILFTALIGISPEMRKMVSGWMTPLHPVYNLADSMASSLSKPRSSSSSLPRGNFLACLSLPRFDLRPSTAVRPSFHFMYTRVATTTNQYA